MEDHGETNVKLARIEVHLAQLTAQIAQMATHLLGIDGKPGIVVRMDRLEQAEQRRSRLIWLSLSVAGTALARVLWR